MRTQSNVFFFIIDHLIGSTYVDLRITVQGVHSIVEANLVKVNHMPEIPTDDKVRPSNGRSGHMCGILGLPRREDVSIQVCITQQENLLIHGHQRHINEHLVEEGLDVRWSTL